MKLSKKTTKKQNKKTKKKRNPPPPPKKKKKKKKNKKKPPPPPKKKKKILKLKNPKKQPNERYNSHEYPGSMFNLSSPDEPHSSAMLTGKISTIRQYNCEKLTIGV